MFQIFGSLLVQNGKWNRSQSSIAQHASVSLHNMFIVNNQLDLPTKQKLELFDSTVSPVLNYAAEVWGYHDAPDVEQILSKFCIMCQMFN